MLIDAHPYLGPAFEFLPRTTRAALLHGLFAFNYSALISLGLSASALSGMNKALPRLVRGIADQLFLDDREVLLDAFIAYEEENSSASGRARPRWESGMTSLSTHVLDTVSGRPAQGMKIMLWSADACWPKAKPMRTGACAPFRRWKRGPIPSRSTSPPISARRGGPARSAVPRCRADPLRRGRRGHYHVPLLASPYAYSTYRGS
jgi:hypothetical protein